MKLLGKYKNGNYTVSIFSDGTKVRETNEDWFCPEWAENMDIKITNKCSMNCAFCHEGSTSAGKHGDILNEKFVDMLHPYQEVAIGGGNVLEHPDLILFLEKLRDRKVIANITVNQVHFEQNFKLIQKLVSEKLIYGLGVSLVNPTGDFISKISTIPNAVIHVINGILKPEDIEDLRDKDLKILILGYKQLRRGFDYLIESYEEVRENQKWLYDTLSDILSMFKVVSFDNLAIEQLEVKRLVKDDEWEEFYMGDDGNFTYYIDMVERKFAQSSTAPFDKRYDLLDSVDEMFKIIGVTNK